MTITKIRAVYFSGTGNTGRTVLMMAQKLSEYLKVPYEGVCINPSIVRKMDLQFQSDELAIVGTPVYDGRVPMHLLPYLQEKLKGQNTPAVAVCTFGNRGFDDALVELRNLLQASGFATIGAAAIVAQHVFAHQCGHNRPGYGDEKQIIKLAKEVSKKVETMDAPPTEVLYVQGNDPVGPYNTPRDRYGYPVSIKKVRPKTRVKQLKNPEIVIKMCPVDAIAPDGIQIPGPCVRCGACVKFDPEKAKFYEDESFLFYQKELVAQFREPKVSEIFF